MDQLSHRQEPNICSSFFHEIFNKVNYFGDNSVLHGIGHVFSLSHIPMIKRLFWLTVLILSAFGAALMLRAAIKIQSGFATFSVETNFLDFDTPFPAVYVCQNIVIDREKLRANMKEIGVDKGFYDFFKDILFWNNEYCKSCKKCKFNTTCYEDAEAVVNSYKLNCSQLLGECWWDEKPFKCCERFYPIMTEYGTCFVFNSQLTGNRSVLTVNSFRLPDLVVSTLKWATIRISSSDDVMSITSDNILGSASTIPIIYDYEVMFSGEQTITDQSVVSLPPSVRHCLMPREHPDYAHDWPFPRYTYGACLWYCRAAAQRDYCNCTHHFMMRLDSVPVCKVDGLKCLTDNAKEILQNKCVCPSECEEVLYKYIHAFGKRHSGKISPELAARGSRGRIRFLQAPGMRAKRQVFRDLMSFVVDLGGFIGVFFGASVLSVIEIVYLFFIRRNT